MTELIDKIEALGKLQTMYIQIERACGDGNLVAKGVRKAYKAIERMPTIEAEPVRHGRWKTIVIHDTFCFQCSACNSVYNGDTHYCPHCGARMDGGVDNEDQ